MNFWGDEVDCYTHPEREQGWFGGELEIAGELFCNSGDFSGTHRIPFQNKIGRPTTAPAIQESTYWRIDFGRSDCHVESNTCISDGANSYGKDETCQFTVPTFKTPNFFQNLSNFDDILGRNPNFLHFSN